MQSRRFAIAGVVGLVALLIWYLVQVAVAPPATLITDQTVTPHGGHRQLAVLIHAYQKRASDMKDVRQAVEELLPDADILVPDFGAPLLGNASPLGLANALNLAIQQVFDRRPGGYEEIILVGHSIGSLLARKAFVIGMGETEELTQSGLRQKPKPWAQKVSRIVLMAGMNRGWSVLEKPDAVAAPKAFAMRAGTWIGRSLGMGKLILGFQRGAPFVVNLSLQWINLTQRGAAMPAVVQLLGQHDDLVYGTDNIDLYGGRDFAYRRVPNTGHADIIQFNPGLAGPAGTGRREAFRYALTSPREGLRANSDFQVELPPPDPAVRKVVFVMHGIRDFGGWTTVAGEKLRAQADKLGMKVVVINSGYGYFPMGGFLLLQERQKNVRWFMNEYTRARALYPHATFNYLGHSNGTYLLASALENYQSIQVDRVVFAGSVVRRGFDWSTFLGSGRVNAIRNYVATADWVVGWFPYFFELFHMSDVGGAGLLGFTDSQAQQGEVHYVAGDHGAALTNQRFEEMAAFLLPPTPQPVSGNDLRTAQDDTVLNVARICWIVWAGLVGLLAGIGYLFSFRWQTPLAGKWWRLAAYSGLVVLLLNTL